MNTTPTSYDPPIERLAALLPAANKLTRSELLELAQAAAALMAERPNPDQLWTLGRVATYLGLDPVLAERVLRQPGAPRPFTNDALWRAADVYRWLDTHSRAQLQTVSTR